MRTFLVVVDQTPESLKALRFAARRAANTSSGVSLLYVIEPEEFQHWRTVEEAMRAEKFQEAEARLQALSDEVKALSGVTPQFQIREGVKREQVLAHIREDGAISVLVLGADAEGSGPGPLVTALAGQMSGSLPVPITIVPGGMTNEEIDAVC